MLMATGFSDPYVELRWSGGKLLARTSVIRRSLNPVWREQKFRLPMPKASEAPVLRASVFDKDTFGSDFLGECLVDVGSLRNSLEVSGAGGNSLILGRPGKWRRWTAGLN